MTGKRPTDHLEPAAKKRGSERQLTKDDFDEEDGEPLEAGTFARASEDVIKQRKIIRARRAAVPSTTTAPAASNPFANVQLTSSTAATTTTASNPFAGVSLVPPTTTENKTTPDNENTTTITQEVTTTATTGLAAPTATTTTTGGFGALASGGGGGLTFGSTAGGFGALSSGTTTGAGGFGGLAFGSATAPLFGGKKEGQESEEQNGTDTKKDADATTTTNDTNNDPNNNQTTTNTAAATTSIFGATPAIGTSVFGTTTKQSTATLPAEVPVSTGEENEQTVFTANGILFEYDANKQWKERGRGEIKVNVEKKESGENARMIMRQKGNLRLLLNAKLWSGMQVTKMEGSTGVTFACMNHLSDDGESNDNTAGKLATYALRIKATDTLDEFCRVVEEHKAKSEG